MLATLLSGCTAMRFAYGQGPELAYWWLDGYADFDDSQTPRVRETLQAWFRWHRETQLEGYAQHLARVQTHAAGPVTPEGVCRIYFDSMARVDPMLEKALPMAVETVRSLSLQQVQHIERKYVRVNRDFRKDFLQPDRDERQQAALKRMVKRAETFYGSLTDAQVDLLRQGLAASPFNPELWLEERMLRQQEALALLRRVAQEQLGPDETLAGLRKVTSHVLRSPRGLYVDYQQKLLQHNCSLAARLHNSASAEQRAAAVKRFKGWEDDARALAAAAKAP